MAKDDLMAHAASDVDFYALLDVQFESSASDIRRAYRKTALKYHPDKLGAAFDPEKFHLLQIANDVLSDEAAKAAYDQRRSAKIQKQKQERLFEGRRRQMKEELEARERGGLSSASTGVKRQRDEAQEMDAEIKKLAEEGKRRRMEMQSKMSEAEKASATPERVATPQPARETARERTPQTAQEEAAEEDEVARLERRIKQLAEAKERKRAEKKARKSGVFAQSETPSESHRLESLHAVGGFDRKNTGAEAKQDTPRRAFDDIKLATPVSSPKFSFSPKPRTAPAGGNDEFAATMRRLKEAEKKRLEDEIRKQEAESPITTEPTSFISFSSGPEPPIGWTGKGTQSFTLTLSRPSFSGSSPPYPYDRATFARFPELPIELQLQIWSYAAIPSKSIRLQKAPFNRSIKSWLPDLRPAQKVMEVHGCLHRYSRAPSANPHIRGPRDPYVLCIVPEGLLGACRLARLEGLERWKIEIENIPVLKVVKGAGTVVELFKEEVVEGLQREIKRLKDG